MRFMAGTAEGNPLQTALMRAMAGTGELSVVSLRALSPLSDKAQVLVDRAVVEVGLQRLVVAADLLAEGLVYPLADPLSVTQLEWDTISKTGGAQRTMNPSARGENQLPNRTPNRLPIYLTTDDFNIGIRTLKMSQRVGQPLDTTLVSQATRRVNEAIEDSVINGSGVVVGGYSAPGLLNAPNANTQTIATAWNTTATGDQIRVDVMSMVSKLQADVKYGPYNLYVGTSYGNALEADFKANGTLTIRQRLEQIEAGGRNLRIRVADQMPTTTVTLVQMTNDVIELVNGQAPTVIPWTSLDGFTLYWLVMAIMIPRVRSDYDGNSGIVIGS
jgi:uncharacterized linocin/CFP29 family protein